jgi:hypothetical protein
VVPGAGTEIERPSAGTTPAARIYFESGAERTPRHRHRGPADFPPGLSGYRPCGVEEIWRYPMKSMAGNVGGGGPHGVG